MELLRAASLTKRMTPTRIPPMATRLMQRTKTRERKRKNLTVGEAFAWPP